MRKNSINLSAPEPYQKTQILQKLKPQTVAIVALIALFSAYLFANIFVRYAADDYCAVREAQQLGLSLIPFSYQTWSANITHIAVLSIIGQIQTSGPSGLWTALMLVLWLGAIYTLLRFFLPEDALLVSLILIVSVLDAAPQLGQSFYWQNGIRHSLSMTLLCVLGWWVLTRSDRFTGWLGAALVALMTVTTAEEIILVTIVLLMFIILRIPSARRRSIAGLIGAVIGVGLMLVAPGTAIRAAAFPIPNVLTSAYYGVIRAGVPFYDALRHGPFILVATAAVLICVGGMSRQAALQVWLSRRDRMRAIMEVLIIIIGINILAEFTGFYALGAELVGRAEIIPIGLTLAAVGVISLQLKRPNWLQSGRLVGIVFTVFVAASIVRVGGFISEISDSAAQWDTRDQTLKAGGPLVQQVSYFDLADIEDSVVNTCIREYYGLKPS